MIVRCIKPSYHLLYGLIGLFLILSHAAFAQRTIVHGEVKDATTGEPLPFVNIAFKGTKTGTTSDINGKFELSTYYASDSLIASFIGYKPLVIKVKLDEEQTIVFNLEPGEVTLKEVVVEYTGNPAELILEKIIQHKEANNREKLDSYEYQVYNKVEFDLNNITDKLKERKIMKNFQFIFDYVDSTEGKPYLPMFMTESVSEYAYRKSPKSKKERIMGTKISGLSNESVSQFLGDMYQNINIYDNNIEVFGKNFISPIAESGLRHYKYYLIDSTRIDGKKCYQIDFAPRHIQESVFKGTMWVNDTTYAIKKIDASLPTDININFINDFSWSQEFQQVNGEYWMLSKDKLLVDFYLSKRAIGIYGRKTTSYRDFIINQPREEKFYQGLDNIVVEENANARTDEFWEVSRHDTLSQNEKEIYEMVDSVKNVPAFRTFVDIISLIFTGYKEVGPLDWGPYYKIYSFNPVEGHRFRLGVRTNDNFSERIRFNGYVAYGTDDERYKTGGGVDYISSLQPRQMVGFSFKDDLEQLGQSRNAFSEDNILSSFLRRNPRNKLTNVEEYKGYYEVEWISGFTTRVIGRKRNMTALGSLSYVAVDDSGEEVVQDNLPSAEIMLYTRFAYREKFVSTGFDRFSLGSKYPILEAYYSKGLSGVLDGRYDFHVVKLAVKDRFRMGTIGYLDWRVEGGMYFGALPYPLLELHPGNESWFYDNSAFNLMNFFEFASDEYLSIMATHHFDGFFLNRIPLLRKLKWREVLTARSVIGNLSDIHDEVLKIPEETRSLSEEPYLEISAGIENIFKVFRVDYLRRLTYLDQPTSSESSKIAKFGIRVTIDIRF